MVHGLNSQQTAAVRMIEGPLLILAGAGTGKTRVITHRIAHMIARGIEPKHILAVTFTNKAAREMQLRVRQLLSHSARRKRKHTNPHRPTICTFHSLGVRILRRHIEALGYKKNFVIYNESEQISIIKKILSPFQKDDSKKDPSALLCLLNHYRNGGERAQIILSDSKLRAEIEDIQKRYRNALKACNAVDFDDLILLPIELFQKHSKLLDTYQKRFQYVMVDEYQDTNARQFELIHHLTKRHQNLCVVGDEDQSIYGWRGAELANLLNLEKYYPELETIFLEQNYRSTNVILKAANAVIQHNVQRKSKTLWSEKGEGKCIELASYADEETEAHSVVSEIEFRRMTQKIPWSDHAILFRTNQQSRSLETALRNAKVRYRLVGGRSFFDRREIKECIAYLKIALNPADDISLLRIANVPARGIGEKSSQSLLALSQEQGRPIFEILCSSSLADFSRVAQKGFEDLKNVITHFHEQLQQPNLRLSDWAHDLFQRTRFLDDLRNSEKNEEVAEMRIRNVIALIEDMDRDASSHLSDQRLQKFLEGLSLEERSEMKEPTGDQVTLITAHSCKGLEFPHVFLVGVEEGLLPHARSHEGSLEEERRLFYVAITRAMHSLNLSFCEARKKYGEKIACRRSSFLAEIPDALIERMDETDKQPVAHELGKSLFASIQNAIE